MTAQDVLDLQGRYHLRVEDYRLLDSSGVFDSYAKTELIEGVIVAVQAQYSPHSRVQTKLLMALSAACDRLGDEVRPWVELSVAIAPDTMPQPDIVVARGLPDSGALPTGQVAVVVEVADTTANTDLRLKARIYAAAGIPEYWVADVNSRLLHQMWTPSGEAYTERREVRFGERIVAATIEGLVVETAGI